MNWLITAVKEQILYGASPIESIVLLASCIIMFGTWLWAYTLIFLKCRREKTYGLPHPSICFNVSWEFLFSFAVVAPYAYWLLEFGNRLWLLIDIALVAQLFLYGKKEQTVPWIKKHFYAITTGTILLSGLGLYLFSLFANDPYGLASSFIGNLTMSILFIGLVFKRPDLKGLSYRAAWLKMIGTFFGGAAFCYLWWPLQFEDGRLRFLPEYAEPSSYGFLFFLYLTIPLFDGIYIYLLGKRRRALRAPAADAVPS